MAPKTYSCTSCPLVNGSTHKVLTSQRAQHNLELKAHRDREMEELAHTVSTLTLADGTQHDRQSHDMELLADMVTVLALTDEGPNPSHQPSKLFSNRDEFQELHAPNIPVGFNPIPISEANASIASILRAPLSTPQPLLPTLSVPSPLPSQPTPRRAANRWVKRDKDLIAEIERQVLEAEDGLVVPETFDPGDADAVASIRLALDTAARAMASAGKSLKGVKKESRLRADVVSKIRLLDMRIAFIGAALPPAPPETAPLPYDAGTSSLKILYIYLC
ncbi:hypothetical protein B0H10DRAFT_2341830 [Mycena sp. CBHHK59/15]|nr:hypothetical protein B0H10DRAFT_2341830 [Mycena sp. CBHHK59/15]